MKKWIGLGCLLVWAAASEGQDTSKLVEYFKRKQNVPPNAQVTVSELTQSKIKGAKTGTITVNNQKVSFLISEDGRYVVFGELEDLTVDPSPQ